MNPIFPRTRCKTWLQLWLLLFFIIPLSFTARAEFTLACSPQNDLFVTMRSCGLKCKRCDAPAQAIEAARPGSAVLLLADEYPAKTFAVPEALYRRAAEKNLHLYVEFPSFAPGRTLR